MKDRRPLVTLSGLAVAAAISLVAAPAASAATTVASHVVAGTSCTQVSEIGNAIVVRDHGMSAFTVRQYIGRCTDGAGTAWMNFGSVYVWQQYHETGTAYRAQVGIAVQDEQEVRGYVTGATRQRLTYSKPVRTVNDCTQGWGKLYRSGDESAQGLSSLRC